MNDQLESVAQVKTTLVDLAIKFGPKVLVAIIILAAGFFFGRWVGRVMDRMLRKLHREVPVRQLLVRIVRILLLGLFAIMALQNLGVELLPLIAGIGIAGAGIALAMQGVLSNVVAGLTIIFTRPFRVGEYVSMIGEEGQVDHIGLFNTTLTHPDLSRVLKDLAPVIQVVMLADWSVNIGVKPWVNVSDYVAASGEINKAIVETFRGRNIVIPFPQREVRILGGAA